MKQTRRRWFRFHLLTAVLATAITGGFIGANIVTRESMFDRSPAFTEKFEQQFAMQLYEIRKFAVVHQGDLPDETKDSSFGWPFVAGGVIESPQQPHIIRYCSLGIAADAAIACAALLAMILVSELFLRRRGA